MFSGSCVAQPLVFYAVFSRSLLVFFSVIRLTAFAYPFGMFKPFPTVNTEGQLYYG